MKARWHLGIATGVMLATPCPIAAHAVPTPDPATIAPAGIPVHDQGLIATWYPPASGKRGPTILALGGSEGGEIGGQRIAQALVARGYGVLALAYFKAPGLPQIMENIPLEYFDTALAWLGHQPLADPKRLGIYGISIGAETALLLAARHAEIKAVVAAVPSSVVWQGYDPADYRSVESTYSLGGQPVPFLRYDTSAAFTSVLDLYQRTLKTADQHPEAAIPVEKIGGSILLLSAADDKLWPSSEMAERVMQRLDARHFAHPHRHVDYADAGHGALSPPGVLEGGSGAYDNYGGTPAGNAAARAAMWPEVLHFSIRHSARPRDRREAVTIEPSDARAALHAAEQSRRRAIELGGYARAGSILIAWGLVWLVGNLASQFRPDIAMWCWPIGIAGAVLWTIVRGERPTDWRVFATVTTAFAFLVLVLAITGGGHREQNAITALLVAASYITLGIWSGARFAWLGIALAVIVCIGWFIAPAWFYLWLGLGGGGALLLGGLWLRRA